MLQIGRCAQCEKEGLDFDTISVEVQLKYHRAPCGTCGEMHTDRTWIQFCSPECLVKYTLEKGFAEEVGRLETANRREEG